VARRFSFWLAITGAAEVGFELNRRFITKCGVKTLGVVDGLDESAPDEGCAFALSIWMLFNTQPSCDFMKLNTDCIGASDSLREVDQPFLEQRLCRRERRNNRNGDWRRSSRFGQSQKSRG
jgi:hypothetical protein